MKLIIEKGTDRYDLSTSSNDPDEQIDITTGNEYLDRVLHLIVPSGIGHYGHYVDLTNMTNLDLIAVLTKDPQTKIVSQAPEMEPNDNIPEGAVT